MSAEEDRAAMSDGWDTSSFLKGLLLTEIPRDSAALQEECNRKRSRYKRIAISRPDCDSINKECFAAAVHIVKRIGNREPQIESKSLQIYLHRKGYRFRYPRQGAPKKEKKKSDVPTYLLFFLCVRFSGLIIENIFMVFLGSSCRETAKNAIKKKIDRKRRKEKSFFFSAFSAKSF
jgi:hypothetical protein